MVEKIPQTFENQKLR